AIVEAMVAAYQISFQMERLRAERPEVFRGARGVLVVALEPDGEAQKAGLRVGDIILQYGDEKLDEPDALGIAIKVKAPGTVTLVVLREGKTFTFEVDRRDLGLGVEAQ